MMYYYDLHIHSVLSPCSDILMTPNNILNMAMLKQLDIIAITDHNSAKQLKTIAEIAKSYDFLFIPGIEITVKEGFDLLIYFKTLKQALLFDQHMEHFLNHNSLSNTHFHEQQIMDINDQVIECYPYTLVQKTQLSVLDLHQWIDPNETLTMIAHFERQAKRIKPYMAHFHYDAIETIHPNNVHLPHIIYNSDSHQLTDLLERTSKNAITLPQLTIDAFFASIKND